MVKKIDESGWYFGVSGEHFVGFKYFEYKPTYSQVEYIGPYFTFTSAKGAALDHFRAVAAMAHEQATRVKATLK